MNAAQSTTRANALRDVLTDLATFSRACYPKHTLRRYQLEAVTPILAAILAGQGGSHVLLFPRQSGKDETLAQLEAFLLARFRISGGSIIMANPTFDPQCLISRRRLLDRVATPLHPLAHSADGNRVIVGRATASFLSTEPTANVRGDTASLALIANESQDVATERWDSAFSPMAASTNAVEIYSGTPWSAGSLLSRETNTTCVHKVTWEEVAEEVPAYGAHVRARIKKLGENHPFIRTEYKLEELGSEGGLFGERRRAHMRGRHPRRTQAEDGKRYAMLLDIAGEDEDAPNNLQVWNRERNRDSMALTIVEVDASTVKDDLLRRPTYRVVDRQEWVGQRHALLASNIVDLARNVWRASWLVYDATGAGQQLGGPLTAALLKSHCEVIPFVFTQTTKSNLGWAFLGCIESGRYKEYAPDGLQDTLRFWAQVENCEYAVNPGPSKTMRWSVPEGRGHDDLLLSAALIGALDELDWTPRTVSSHTRQDYT